MDKTVNSKESPGYQSIFDFIDKNPKKRVDGFPFQVGFPKLYGGKKYNIITVSGELLNAIVDDSREFMSEGLEWKTKQGNKTQAAVAAWQLIEEPVI
ncbi:hypothetical protein KC929_02765 [Patescibacteria group bacterium]|nr:hypothetical protein [Patescibacteria group bacterium]